MQYVLTFLREWQKWADDGAPNHMIFVRDWGLCTNFARWLKARKPNFTDDEIRYVYGHLLAMFKGKKHPFGRNNLYREHITATTHLNADRRFWVGEAINQLSTKLREKK